MKKEYSEVYIIHLLKVENPDLSLSEIKNSKKLIEKKIQELNSKITTPKWKEYYKKTIETRQTQLELKI